MKAYKLTDKHDRTRNGTQWGEGVTHETSGEGELCGHGWLHYYEDPLLALLHNPIHGNFNQITMHLWEINVDGSIKADRQMKSGCTKMTTLRRIELPVITRAQRVKYAILCALCVCEQESFVTWANKWLSGEDRSEKSADSVLAAARANRAANRAAWSATRAATWDTLAELVTWATQAELAAEAALAALETKKPINLVALAKKAMEK